MGLRCMRGTLVFDGPGRGRCSLSFVSYEMEQCPNPLGSRRVVSFSVGDCEASLACVPLCRNEHVTLKLVWFRVFVWCDCRYDATMLMTCLPRFRAVRASTCCTALRPPGVSVRTISSPKRLYHEPFNLGFTLNITIRLCIDYTSQPNTVAQSEAYSMDAWQPSLLGPMDSHHILVHPQHDTYHATYCVLTLRASPYHTCKLACTCYVTAMLVRRQDVSAASTSSQHVTTFQAADLTAMLP
jgi:hypothetical protein